MPSDCRIFFYKKYKIVFKNRKKDFNYREVSVASHVFSRKIACFVAGGIPT